MYAVASTKSKLDSSLRVLALLVSGAERHRTLREADGKNSGGWEICIVTIEEPDKGCTWCG